jgi:hypothetical protein
VVGIVAHGNAENFRRFLDVVLFHKGNMKAAHIHSLNRVSDRISRGLLQVVAILWN